MTICLAVVNYWMAKKHKKKRKEEYVIVGKPCSYEGCDKPAIVEFVMKVRLLTTIVSLEKSGFNYKYACQMHWSYLKSATEAVGKFKPQYVINQGNPTPKAIAENGIIPAPFPPQ